MIQGTTEILSLFLTKRLATVSSTTNTLNYVAKGTTVLDDGKIAGVIFTYTKTIIGVTGTLQKITETMNCHIYIHN